MTKWRVVFLLWALQLVNFVDRASLAVAGPDITKELVLSASQFGLVLSAFSLGYAIMQIPGGLLADRFGPRLMLVAAPILWSIFAGATGLAISLETLVGIRLLFGMAEGSANASIFKIQGEQFAIHDRGFLGNLVVTAYALGPAAAAPFVSLIARAAGWRAVFFASAVPGVLVAILLWWALPRLSARNAVARVEPVSTSLVAAQPTLIELLKLPRTWLLFGSAMLFNVAYWGLLGWMPTYLSRARGLDLKALGWAASVPYVGAAVGLVVLGALDRRFFSRARPMLISVSFCLAALSLGWAFQAKSVGESLAGLTAAAFFLWGSLGLHGGVVIGLAPAAARGAFSGLMSTGTQIGGIFAPLIIGLLVHQTRSFAGGFAFMIGSLLVSAAGYAALHFLIRNDIVHGLPDEAAVQRP